MNNSKSDISLIFLHNNDMLLLQVSVSPLNDFSSFKKKTTIYFKLKLSVYSVLLK